MSKDVILCIEQRYRGVDWTPFKEYLGIHTPTREVERLRELFPSRDFRIVGYARVAVFDGDVPKATGVENASP